jgi:large subunit ribosomal protein L35
MPKVKTRKAVSKRFKIGKAGKVKRSCASHRHLATAKTRKRKRQLRSGATASKADAQNMKKMLPYG